jgi:G:T-mismatch repair DNA endonuclease (very short patch repair protein)
MVRSPIQLGVRLARLAHQNTAVVQACVPLMNLKGDSYRLKDKDLGSRPPGKTPEIG